MPKPRINFNDAYRVLGGVNDADRIEYERIRLKMIAKRELSAEEKDFVWVHCENGRLLKDQAAKDAYTRLFSESEG